MNSGDYVSVKLAREDIKGVLLESYDKSVVLLKLESGYNIGIPKENIFDIKVIRKGKKIEDDFKIPESKGKKKIGLIVTGGTIASKLDPRTGGVNALTEVGEFAKFYPKLFEKCKVDVVSPFMELSENMGSSHWKKLANEVKKMLDDKSIEGIIITHGSDTLHYTSAVLSFMLDVNKPVALTFSQRSIDRGSSDAELNLICSAEFALSNAAEVVIVGHATSDDEYCHALRGTKVRKMHTSRRDTFDAINDKPIARVWPDKIKFLGNYKAKGQEVTLDDKFNDKIALVKFYPGQDSKIIDYYMKRKYKGVIIEMTGLGHVSENWISKLKKCIKSGVFVCGTAQTIYGALNPKVYSTGRKLEKIGVIYLKDMLSETAFVKLGWVLGHKNWDVKKKMLENISGEFNNFLD